MFHVAAEYVASFCHESMEGIWKCQCILCSGLHLTPVGNKIQFPEQHLHKPVDLQSLPVDDDIRLLG